MVDINTNYKYGHPLDSDNYNYNYDETSEDSDDVESKELDYPDEEDLWESEYDGKNDPTQWQIFEDAKKTTRLPERRNIVLPQIRKKRKRVLPRETDTCCICLESLTKNLCFCDMECGTIFHKKCVNTIIACPICRTKNWIPKKFRI